MNGSLLLLVSLLVCFGAWRWAGHVLVPANTFAAQRSQVPIGNNSDLYPPWIAARELLLHRRDPYSAAVTEEIQRGFYGWPLDPAQANNPPNQAMFAYPAYVVFLLAPTVTAPFTLVATFAKWFALASIAVSVPLWSHAIGVRVRVVHVLSAIVLALSAYPSMLEFYMQNLTALVALVLALACAASVRGWFILCGFLLALSTIKPQISAVFVVSLLIWVSGDWKARRRLAFSFSLTLFLLGFGAELLLPGWPWEFVAALHRYWHYTANPSGLRMFFPAPVAWILSGALVGALFWAVWRRRKPIAGSSDFGWLLALASAVTVVIAPIALYNQVLLVPALLIVTAQRELIRPRGFVVRGLAKAPLACLGWHWISSAVLGLSSLTLPAERLRVAAYVPLYTVLALPAVTLLALAAVTTALPLQPPENGIRQ